MATLGSLADRVLQLLQGDSLDQAEQTFLTADVSPADLTLAVDDVSQLSQGLAEIGSELVWIKGVDRQAGTVALSPFGRGYRSTQAVSHLAGTAVVNSPRYSRAKVLETINTCIESSYPDLFTFKAATFPYVAARNTYALPADCEQLHSLAWESVGPSRTWIRANDYRFDPNADTDAFPSGKSVDIWEPIVPGRTIRVSYITSPTPLDDESQSFTASGLAATAEEAILYGACYRLIGFLEPPRLQTAAVESSARSQLVPPGAGVNAAKFFYGLYLEALSNERERLLRIHGTTVHRTRRLI
ncbi:hypothetical protein AB0C33_01860 [Nonomuraea sp. NPDC048881]|uniref:phage adaptor protein n=1 Tax=Nonomuraea sp. NPDC048881 TaxID=3155030 RepID=UPI0033EBE162